MQMQYETLEELLGQDVEISVDMGLKVWLE